MNDRLALSCPQCPHSLPLLPGPPPLQLCPGVQADSPPGPASPSTTPTLSNWPPPKWAVRGLERIGLWGPCCGSRDQKVSVSRFSHPGTRFLCREPEKARGSLSADRRESLVEGRKPGRGLRLPRPRCWWQHGIHRSDRNGQERPPGCLCLWQWARAGSPADGCHVF